MLSKSILIAAALAGGPPLSPPPPILVSPQRSEKPLEVEITRPSFDFDCSLTDASKRRFALAIEMRGGRGYIDPRSGGKLDRFKTTALTFRVIRDEASLFNGVNLTGFDAGGVVIEARHAERNFVRIRMLPTGEGWNSAAIVYVNATESRFDGLVKYTGFCSVTRYEQVPLTKEEAEKYIAQ